MWIRQDFSDKELIIYNTDQENPIVLHESLKKYRIRVINNGIDMKTKKPYTNTGAIRRDAVNYASGNYFMLWDDDDLYLHFNLRQAYEQINRTGKKAWKPEQSFFWNSGGLRLTRNVMEASVIVEMESIRKYGFKEASGPESLTWYNGLKDSGDIIEDESYFVPAYCFNWNDPKEIADHKQSSTIDDPNNFEIHKQRTKDAANEALTPLSEKELDKYLQPMYSFIEVNRGLFPEDLYKKYAV
jgi:hypothetical protein